MDFMLQLVQALIDLLEAVRGLCRKATRHFHDRVEFGLGLIKSLSEPRLDMLEDNIETVLGLFTFGGQFLNSFHKLLNSNLVSAEFIVVVLEGSLTGVEPKAKAYGTFITVILSVVTFATAISIRACGSTSSSG